MLNQNGIQWPLFKFHVLYSCLSPELPLPWEEAVVVATVMGDLPLAWADWLVVETEVLVEEGELVGGRCPAALVIVASRPSGFVPYCTGWNNLIREKKKKKIVNIKISILQLLNLTTIDECPKILTTILHSHFIADLMGFIGHGLGRGCGSWAV